MTELFAINFMAMRCGIIAQIFDTERKYSIRHFIAPSIPPLQFPPATTLNHKAPPPPPPPHLRVPLWTPQMEVKLPIHTAFRWTLHPIRRVQRLFKDYKKKTRCSFIMYRDHISYLGNRARYGSIELWSMYTILTVTFLSQQEKQP